MSSRDPSSSRPDQAPTAPTTHKVHVPQGNDSALQKAAAPVATISSHSDPWPHYIMAGACGGASWHSYAKAGNPRMAAVKLGLGLSYLWAGRILVTGNPRVGYDLGTVTSLALAATAGPRAWATGEMASTVMASLGGVSAVTNLIKSYQMRTGRPHEIGYSRD